MPARIPATGGNPPSQARRDESPPDSTSDASQTQLQASGVIAHLVPLDVGVSPSGPFSDLIAWPTPRSRPLAWRANLKGSVYILDHGALSVGVGLMAGVPCVLGTPVAICRRAAIPFSRSSAQAAPQCPEFGISAFSQHHVTAHPQLPRLRPSLLPLPPIPSPLAAPTISSRHWRRSCMFQHRACWRLGSRWHGSLSLY